MYMSIWNLTIKYSSFSRMFIFTSNLRILEKPATTDKFSRAQPVSAAWNDGRVLLPENTKWTEPLVHEVASFTGVNDVHDDQVDVLSTLYNSLNRSQKPLWRIS